VSPSQCRNQGAVHATACKVQQAGCGARHRLQRCRKQGAVHGLGVQGARHSLQGAGSRVRCTPQPAKVQEAGCGARVGGAVHATGCKGAGSRVGCESYNQGPTL
jgi:hypothetical protein